MPGGGLLCSSAEWHEKGCQMGKAQVWQALVSPGRDGSPKDQVTTYCRIIFNRGETLEFSFNLHCLCARHGTYVVHTSLTAGREGPRFGAVRIGLPKHRTGSRSSHWKCKEITIQRAGVFRCTLQLCHNIFFHLFSAILRKYSIAKSSNVTLEKKNPLG